MNSSCVCGALQAGRVLGEVCRCTSPCSSCKEETGVRCQRSRRDCDCDCWHDLPVVLAHTKERTARGEWVATSPSIPGWEERAEALSQSLALLPRGTVCTQIIFLPSDEGLERALLAEVEVLDLPLPAGLVEMLSF